MQTNTFDISRPSYLIYRRRISFKELLEGSQARVLLEKSVLLVDRQGLVFAPQCPEKALRLPWGAIERLDLPEHASCLHILLKEEWARAHKKQLLDQYFVNGIAQDVYHEIHDNWLILDHDNDYAVSAEDLFEVLKAYQQVG